MTIELQCSRCNCRFETDPDTPTGATLDNLSELGPWHAVGDGETLEDALHAQLSEQGLLHCPECGAVVLLREEELNKIALQLLVNW